MPEVPAPEQLEDWQISMRRVIAGLADRANHEDLETWVERPHPIDLLGNQLSSASLDHAMWFHRPLREDEWLLYTLESPSMSGARGLTTGRFYRRDGTLVASVVQEGLFRLRSEPDAD